MGRVEVRGAIAAEFLNTVLSFDVPGLRTGRAKYGVVCDQDGGIIDDTILYRLGEERYLLVPNASNADAVIAWLERWVLGRGRCPDRRGHVTPGHDGVPGSGRYGGASRTGRGRPRQGAAIPYRGDPLRRSGHDAGPNRIHGRGRVRADDAIGERGRYLGPPCGARCDALRPRRPGTCCA